MMKFPTTVDKIAYCGDWHGNVHWAVHILDELAKQGVKVVIHLGDYGYRFAWDFIREQHAILEANDMLLMFVEGNHDDHDYLEGIPVSLDGTRKIADRIWHLPRGFRWKWDGITFLALGGALSIDKHLRIPGFSWWWQEAITWANVVQASNDGEADVLVTHEAPIDSNVPMMGFLNLPEDIQRETNEQRMLLQEVGESVKPVLWWHGHHHVAYQDVIEFSNGQECQVTGLDCDGFSFNDNVNIIEMRTIQRLVDYNKKRVKGQA